MRLFVAVVPDAAVTAAIDALLPPALTGTGWRAVAPGRRHVTLRFLADADPAVTAAALRRDLAGAPAPRLRTTGAGVFGTALWLGVRVADPAGWEALLRAVGTDPGEHVAHLTVARGRDGDVPETLAGHRGPAWAPGEVLLVASGTPYRVVDEFPLVGGGARPGDGAGGDGTVGPPA
ncbi:2'-5' RNA ligase family protein [Actinomycetospora sp.]|uniref:2'-5' RNA ligase family protein n=1 Tax=Actinomycetospora sp. TaxID=1872135 RepID=UPI002F3F0F51